MDIWSLENKTNVQHWTQQDSAEEISDDRLNFLGTGLPKQPRSKDIGGTTVVTAGAILQTKKAKIAVHDLTH